MELAGQSVSELFLAKGDMPLGLNHEAPTEAVLDHTVHAEVKDITLHIIGLEGHKIELPIPSEAIIEPISPAEVILEESGLIVGPHEATEEEIASNDDSKDSQDHLIHGSSDLGVPNEIIAVSSSVLDSTAAEALSELIVYPSEVPVVLHVTEALDPKALLDPSALAKEAACADDIPEDSASDVSSLRDEGCPKKEKGARKNIPPKKDRMDPLKMDMSRPVVIPLTSSQLSLQCLECHIIFSDNKSKERHLKMNHPTEYEQCMLGDALFACYVCDRHFTCSTELMAHQRSHTEKQPFKCPICGEAFSRSSELTNHKKIHIGKHGYTCSDCGKPCKTLTLLKYHQRIHTGERPYVCIHKQCGKRFSMPKALQKHLELHEKGDTEGTVDLRNGTTSIKKKRNRGPSTKKYACSQCDESFKSAKSQLHHIKSKHVQCKITAPSSSTGAHGLNGTPLMAIQPSAVQPPVLRMEAIGPAPQQIGPLGAEQIKRLIEKLGNVQKVNQLVILGIDQLPFQPQAMGMQQPQHLLQPLHFNFTEPTTQPIVVQQTEDQLGHNGTLSTGTEQTTCKEALEVGMSVEQAMVQEERSVVLSASLEEQMAAIESDMTEAQLNEVQLELVPELIETSVSTPQLEASVEHTTEEPGIQVSSDISIVETGNASPLTSMNDFESQQFQTIEEEHLSLPKDLMASEETIIHEESQRQKLDDISNSQSQTTEEEHVSVLSEMMVAEETITREESFGEQPNEAVETEAQTEQVNIVTLNNSQDLEGHLEQSEQDIPCTDPSVIQLSPKVQNDQESSHLEQEPSNESVIWPSAALMGEQVQPDIKASPHVKKIRPMKKKRSKKQATHTSERLEPQGDVAKTASQTTPSQKTNTPSKAVPKKGGKKKTKKLVYFGPKEKSSKPQTLQISKSSLLKNQQHTSAGKGAVSSKNDGVAQVKQKNQKPKKGRKAENSTGVLKAFKVSSETKMPGAPRGKAQKRKFEKVLVKKVKSQGRQQEETPLPKKKKQGKASEAAPEKKAKVKSATRNELRKGIPKLAKREKEQKSVSESSSQDQIKQQALLLLKGHKQPQLKVHKLDPKTTGLEQPLIAKCQTKAILDGETMAVKAKGGTKKKALTKRSQKKKKTKMVGKEPKEDQISVFQMTSIDSDFNSALSRKKAKVPRKRKAPTKIDQEIALRPPFSKLTIGCHDCGKKFLEVSALQEHMASMHSENGLLRCHASCDVSNDQAMSTRSNDIILTNGVSSRNFEIQVSTDWDMDTEMRDIGLGDRDVHRLSFPALSLSPSFPLTSTGVEIEGKVGDRVCQDTCPGHLGTVGENSIEISQPFPKGSSIGSDTSYIQTADKKSVGMENTELELVPPNLGPQENMNIKEELPSDVKLVMVDDQEEGDTHTQANGLFNSQEVSGQQEVEPHEMNDTTTESRSQLPEENRDPTSSQNENSEIKQEEEELLVQKGEKQTKTSITRGRKGRGGRGRGKRQPGKRSAAENRSKKEVLADKEECQVVFQLYALTDSCEEKNEEGERQREVSSAPTVNTQSTLEETQDQVIFQLQPVSSRVAEVMNADNSSLIPKPGQEVKNGTSGVVLGKDGRMREQGDLQPEAEGLTSTGTSTDVKIEANASVPATHDVHPNDKDLLQGVRVFLVKMEDHEPHVIQGNQHTQTHHAISLDGICSGSPAALQSTGKQCIFYPVKEEEGEILVEPPHSEARVPEERTGNSGSWAASGLEECEEVRVGCTQMEVHHTLYSSSEEGDAGTEQQSTQGFLEFLSQSSDMEDIDNLQSEPEAETHIMSCYRGVCTNRAVQHQKSSPEQTDSSSNRNMGYSETEHRGGSRKDCWKPIDYFIQYFSWDTWKEIAACTGQVTNLPNPVTEKEVSQFVGIHIAMGTLKFPSMKLYWEDCTRVPLIADAMLASRFSELTCKLRLLSPAAGAIHRERDEQRGQESTSQLGTGVETPRQIPEPGGTSCGYQDAGNCLDISVSKIDPLWKVQAIVNRVQEGCRGLKRHGNHGVDQYSLPFQRHPTHSLHHTVMINVTGLVMDFNMRVNDSNREEVVEQMVSWKKDDNQGMIFLCKPELSTPSMLEHLLEAGVRSAGKVGGARGQVGDEFMTSDRKLKLFRCHHGFILSAVMKEKSRSTSLVSGFERAIKAANLNRDLRSLYRTPCTSPSPGAWPMSVLWDLIDLALVNSWLQYKDDHNHVPEPLSLMAFRLEVSKALILPSSTDTQDSSTPYPPDPESPNPNLTTATPSDGFETPLPDATTRYDGLGHWPEQLAEGEEARCRFGGCERTSRVRCLKCCVFLCISRSHNCFLKFHSQGAA